MSNLLLTVYKELQKNNPYSHEYMETVLQKVNVKKKKSELTAVIHSSRLLSYGAIEYFALFMHEKYPQFSIEVTNTFDKDTLCEKDFPTLFRLFSESVTAVPTMFFEDADVTLEDKVIRINLSQGKNFLDAVNFSTAFAEYLMLLVGKEYKIVLSQSKEAKQIERPVYELENKVVKIVEKSKYDDFEIPNLKIKKDSVKIIHGKYQSIKPKDFISIDKALNDTGKVTVWGKVFAVAEQGNFRKIFIYSITDGTNSINLKILLDPNDKNIEKWENIKPGVHFAVKGDCQMDKYERDFVIMPYDIIAFDLQKKKDTAEVKRVELHLHTKMSAMDGLIDPPDAVKKAFEYGHRAVAITDHGVVQGYPQAMLEYDAIKKNNPDADFKLIYGCEGYFVDNMIDIYSGNRSGNISDTEFVVFDIETTGLSPAQENITEIGAILVKGEQVLDEFHTFVDPEKPIPAKITELTGITDAMVKG
ncbi:MAG: PHP domain-containing protein, partial [Oscillospiraceae bacterium]|nr:PHP domain-containing protein [Oscillospiraceae bacterium]